MRSVSALLALAGSTFFAAGSECHGPSSAECDAQNEDHELIGSVMLLQTSLVQGQKRITQVVDSTLVLATFDGAEGTTLPFATVNDPVMGGQSTSAFSNDEGGVGVFEGEVAVVPFLGSPGFCILAAPGYNAPAIEFPDISGTDGITVVGQQTRLEGLSNWYVGLRTEAIRDAASPPNNAVWQADFENFDDSDQHFVPYSAFRCSFRGNLLDNCGDLSEQLAGLTQVSVGSSGISGSFRLELISIAATAAPLSLAQMGGGSQNAAQDAYDGMIGWRR